MSGAVKITGLRETTSALRKIDKQLPKVIQTELKKAAEPVAASAREKISRFKGAKLNTIRPRATGSAVYVRQNARKVSGLRPDFGRLQQADFEEALDENHEEVEDRVEKALDALIDEF